ncbi:MAG: hypothetical protein WBA63_08905 [Thermomicrobiales bacterium]
MDVLAGLIRAIIMGGFVVFVIAALAALFMIVFSFATSFDRKVQE